MNYKLIGQVYDPSNKHIGYALLQGQEIIFVLKLQLRALAAQGHTIENVDWNKEKGEWVVKEPRFLISYNQNGKILQLPEKITGVLKVNGKKAGYTVENILGVRSFRSIKSTHLLAKNGTLCNAKSVTKKGTQILQGINGYVLDNLPVLERNNMVIKASKNSVPANKIPDNHRKRYSKREIALAVEKKLMNDYRAQYLYLYNYRPSGKYEGTRYYYSIGFSAYLNYALNELYPELGTLYKSGSKIMREVIGYFVFTQKAKQCSWESRNENYYDRQIFEALNHILELKRNVHMGYHYYTATSTVGTGCNTHKFSSAIDDYANRSYIATVFNFFRDNPESAQLKSLLRKYGGTRMDLSCVGILGAVDELEKIDMLEASQVYGRISPVTAAFFILCNVGVVRKIRSFEYGMRGVINKVYLQRNPRYIQLPLLEMSPGKEVMQPESYREILAYCRSGLDALKIKSELYPDLFLVKKPDVHFSIRMIEMFGMTFRSVDAFNSFMKYKLPGDVVNKVISHIELSMDATELGTLEHNAIWINPEFRRAIATNAVFKTQFEYHEMAILKHMDTVDNIKCILKILKILGMEKDLATFATRQKFVVGQLSVKKVYRDAGMERALRLLEVYRPMGYLLGRYIDTCNTHEEKLGLKEFYEYYQANIKGGRLDD